MDDLVTCWRRTMMVRAYAPYSKFHVGAAVRDEDGGIHARLQCRERRLSAGLLRRGRARSPRWSPRASGACWNAR